MVQNEGDPLMAGYTMDQIYVRILREFKTADFQFFYEDARDVLAEIVRSKAGMWKYLVSEPFDIAMPDDETYFDLPDDFSVLIGIWNVTRNFKLREWTTGRFLRDARPDVGDGTGTAIRYKVIGNGSGGVKLSFPYGPHEATDLEVYYYRMANAPSAPTDLVDLPDYLQAVFLDGLRSKYAALTDPANAAGPYAKFRQGLQEAKMSDAAVSVPYMRNIRSVLL